MTAFLAPRRLVGRGHKAARRTSAGRAKTRASSSTSFWSSTPMLLVLTVGVLNIVGVVMVLSASSVSSLTDYGSPWYFFLRQLMWTLVGIVAFVIGIRLDYRVLRRLVRPLLIVSAVLLVAVLIPGVGVHVSGSRRWIGAGFLRFQPSELAKLALLLYAADLASRRAREVGDWRRVLKPVLVVLGGFVVLVMRQPDMGSAIVLAMVTMSVLIASGVRAKHLAVVGVAGASLMTLLAYAEPYRRARMLTFLHPFSDRTDQGYQIAQSLIAIGSGGWTGVGLGASRAKWNFLPNAHTDFIFAIIAEELGLLGGILVLALFAVFAVLGIRTAARAADRFGALLAVGITTWVVGQAVINVGAVCGLLPITGIPLPFISFGGTALVTTMFGVGVLVNIARRGERASTSARPSRPTSARAGAARRAGA
ncbi:MAG TPA: putative lipid II flippase FtsW [Acidimicrobiia bacterium]|nr:putative lipid II flippase FtsW [Acidimicrobiia bacterium]